MTTLSNELVERSITAMVSAVEIYNKPGFSYRAESFAILAINAWELLLKGKWVSDNQEKEDSLYVYESVKNRTSSTGSRRQIKRNRSGNPHTHSLHYLAKQLTNTGSLDHVASSNIQLIVEFRDSAVHFFSRSPHFRSRLHEIGAACVKNFATVLDDWFDRQLSEFELHLMPLSFVDTPSQSDAILLNAAEENFLSFLDSYEESDGQDASDPRYFRTMSVEVRLTGSKDKSAMPMRLTTDPSAREVRLTDDQFRDRYPWDYKELTGRCRERYSDFKQDSIYHKIRKKLHDDPRIGSVRFLDPGNPKSSKKDFFSPSILNELDKHYTRHARR